MADLQRGDEVWVRARFDGTDQFCPDGPRYNLLTCDGDPFTAPTGDVRPVQRSTPAQRSAPGPGGPPVGSIVHDRAGCAWKRQPSGFWLYVPASHPPRRSATEWPPAGFQLPDDAIPWERLIVRYGPITMGLQP